MLMTKLFLMAALAASAASPAVAAPLFDGRSFEGWEGDTAHTWRIENESLVAGSLTQEQKENRFLSTRRQYENFELRLQWRLQGSQGFVNGGVQFRSARIPGHHEMIGYQADLGADYDGALYDESRRRRMLAQPTPEVLAKARRKLGQWNDYRIRAEGPRIRIWLNEVLTVDHVETDEGIARRGHIAVQIHGNCTALVEYRRLELDELPADSKAQSAAPKLELKPAQTIALVGASNIERSRFEGSLHAHLVAAAQGVKVRNFGWEGDTVFEQWRDAGGGGEIDPKTGAYNHWRQQRDWGKQLREAGVGLVLAQFGQMESLRGQAGLADFERACRSLFDELAADGRQLALISPMPFEGAMVRHNVDLCAYAAVIGKLARERQCPFVDLSLLPAAAKPRSANGWQLTLEGQREIAALIVEGLGLPLADAQRLEALRPQVLEAERLWFDFWRPMNWAFLQGDRTHVAYSRDWKDSNKRIFPQEMQDFAPLIAQADANLQATLNGGEIKPIAARSSIPVEAPTQPPQSPEQELASLKILDGFELSLFASEADGVIKPIQMRWDERGRLWVACTVSYPQILPGAKPSDYILVCEDRNGDGRADHFTRFAEGLFMPSGLEFGDGGLYVAQGTELLHLRDRDGDGRADERRIVLGGFGTADSHQMINCINWGFGGELWFTQGHHIYSRVETPFGVETLNRAGLWRYRPRSGHLDAFFQYSSAGANCWGVIHDAMGQPFHKSGANIGGYYSTPGMVRSMLATSAQAMNLFDAPIKQVGLEFLHSSHFPPEMQGRAIIGGYYANLLEQHELRLENGLYRSRRLPNLIETSNPVFRPVEVRMGPDGGLYIADWYNPIIGHYQASYRHPDRDKAHGRIWRLSAKGRPLLKPVNLSKLSTEQLLEQLDSGERWAWYQAKRLLLEKDPGPVLAAADAWAVGKSELRRLHVLSLHEGFESPAPALLEELLEAKSPAVRAVATRSIATWARDNQLPKALSLLRARIADTDPQVRLEAIVAASYVSQPQAAVVAAAALDREFNEYHRHALVKMLHSSRERWAPLLISGKLRFARDEHLLFALRNAWIENNAQEVRTSGGSYSKSPQELRADAQVLNLLQSEVKRQQGKPERQRLWLEALAELAQNPKDLDFVLEQSSTDPGILAKINAKPTQPARWLASMLREDAPEALQTQGARLAGLWQSKDQVALLRQWAAQATGGARRQQARLALVSLEPEAYTKHALQTMSQAAKLDPIKAEMAILVARDSGRQALITQLRQPKALQPAVAKLALQALHQLGQRDQALATRLSALAGFNAALPVYSPDTVNRLTKAASTRGQAALGKQLYEQIGCAACHMPGPANSRIGPDLSAISRGLPLDMIVTEVVWPALNIKEGYEVATLTKRDGSVLTGFKQTETSDTLTLREPASGKLQPIAKSEIRDLQLGGSLMPETAASQLNEEQLAHLIAYLASLGR